MKVQGSVETGRHLPRQRTYECESCHVRNAVGTPKTMDTWPARLHAVPLTLEQWELLLTAAAEYRELCESCQHCEHGELTPSPHPGNRCGYCGCQRYEEHGHFDPISFLDWVRTDALGITHTAWLKVEPPAVSLAEKRRRAGYA